LGRVNEHGTLAELAGDECTSRRGHIQRNFETLAPRCYSAAEYLDDET